MIADRGESDLREGIQHLSHGMEAAKLRASELQASLSTVQDPDGNSGVQFMKSCWRPDAGSTSSVSAGVLTTSTAC